jgi:PEP-CTERM motif
MKRFACGLLVLTALLAFARPVSAGPSLIVNGDFETGNFSGWSQAGDLNFTGVNGGTVHSGNFAAFLGPQTPGFLFQSFATTAGTTYALDYWLQSEGGTPNFIEARINGVAIPGSVLTDADDFDYKEYKFDFVATGATTELRFAFEQVPNYWHLDDVAVTEVTPVPEPATLTLLGIGIAGMVGYGWRRRKQAQA